MFECVSQSLLVSTVSARSAQVNGDTGDVVFVLVTLVEVLDTSGT